MLVDFGEVISYPQSRQGVADLAELTGLDPATFEALYWKHRPMYDLGCSAAAYWSTVLERNIDDQDPFLTRLLQVDIASWLNLNAEVLDILGAAKSRGQRLALLSNAPADFAEPISTHPGFAIFERCFFSGVLGVVKPHASIFEQVLYTLGTEVGQVTFIDDRSDNVNAAAALGIRAIHFNSAAQLRSELQLD